MMLEKGACGASFFDARASISVGDIVSERWCK